MKEKKEIYIRGEIRALKPYSVDQDAVRLKLDANESPYDLPQEVKDEIFASLRYKPFNRYPDPGANALREVVSKELGLSRENILFGNGSDELIQLLVTVYGGPGLRAVFPVPTFEMYKVLAQAGGMVPVAVPLKKKSLDLDVEEFVAEAGKDKTQLVFLAYPNSPTGNCFSAAKIEKIIKAAAGLVVVDEAYFHFCGKSFVPKIKDYPNLVVLRTFSKAFGLAGVRAGFAAAQPQVIENLLKVKLPYNLNSLTQTAVQFALRHEKKLLEKVEEILKERDKLMQGLTLIPGVQPYPSDANFILFQCSGQSEKVYEALKQQGILIRNLKDFMGLQGFFRVTVGKPEENQEFLKILDKIVRGMEAV